RVLRCFCGSFFLSHASDSAMVVPARGLRKAAHGCAAVASQPWMADRAGEQPAGRDESRPQAWSSRVVRRHPPMGKEPEKSGSRDRATRIQRNRNVAPPQAIPGPNVSVNTRLPGKSSTMPHPVRRRLFAATIALAACGSVLAAPPALNDLEYFSKPGLDVLAFNNYYDGLFSDSKHAGVELIHHGVRTATNGDVRLSPTPEQWDAVALLVDRKVDARTSTVTTRLGYAEHGFEYDIRVSPAGEGVKLQVVFDKPLPRALEGKAGFNLEFLPSAYWGKTWLTEAGSGQLPLYPAGPTTRGGDGKPVRLPMASGRSLPLAPEDPQRRVTINSNSGELGVFDGRNQAQNGWYVVRGLLPAGKTGVVLEWTLEGNTVPGWTRPAVIGHSQVGYHPAQRKVAVLESDRRAAAPGGA